MKIATFNVNSLRKRLPIVLDCLEKHQPDVLCLQETKVQDSEFPALALVSTGYHVTFRGMKGYNGVAVLSRTPPDSSRGQTRRVDPRKVRIPNSNTSAEIAPQKTPQNQ